MRWYKQQEGYDLVDIRIDPKILDITSDVYACNQHSNKKNAILLPLEEAWDVSFEEGGLDKESLKTLLNTSIDNYQSSRLQRARKSEILIPDRIPPEYLSVESVPLADYEENLLDDEEKYSDYSIESEHYEDDNKVSRVEPALSHISKEDRWENDSACMIGKSTIATEKQQTTSGESLIGIIVGTLIVVGIYYVGLKVVFPIIFSLFSLMIHFWWIFLLIFLFCLCCKGVETVLRITLLLLSFVVRFWWLLLMIFLFYLW